MTSAILRFDYCTSLLLSADAFFRNHELPDQFAYTQTPTDDIRQHYLQFITTGGFFDQKRGRIKLGQFLAPEKSDLFDLLNTRLRGCPPPLQEALQHFDASFAAFFERITHSQEKNVREKQTLLDKHFPDIRENALALAPLTLPQTHHVNLIVTPPSAPPGISNPDASQQWLSMKYLKKTDIKFLRMVVHEFVGHQYTPHFLKRLEKPDTVDYTIDEAFAKFISNILLEQVLGKALPYDPSLPNKRMSSAYHTFLTQWGGHKDSLENWFAECVQRLRESTTHS